MPGYPSTLDLANLGSFGFVLRGETITDNAGFSVSSAGDINNDGYADVIVGSPSSNRAYVVFGKAGGFGTVFLGSLTPADGFRITGEVSTDAAGYSVASAGDINNDGYDDIILGAELLGGFNEGAAYVLFGKASGFADISLATLAASDGFKISGDTTIGRLGHSVASAGDYNNDGYDDIIVGAPDDNAGNTGHAYLIFGKATGFGPVNVLALGPTDGFAITGAAAGDNAGNSVSSAGDVNNDGYDDLIIGAPLNDSGGASSGAAYVLFGRAVGFGPINLAALTPADGFKIQGLTGNQAGTAVATAGDFNGDGYADLLVGSPLVSRSGNSQVGEAYLIFGKASGFTTINLNTIAPADGFRVINTGPFDHAGASVSAAGDVNGDGYDDLIVGVPGADLSSGNDGGEAFIVFGKASGFGPIDLATMTARDGFEIQGAEPGDLAGTGIGAAGDVNNDGYDDIIVGSPGALGSNEGAAYVVFGRSTAGTATIDNGATDDHYVTSYTEQGSEAGVSDGNVTLSSGAPINSMTITISDPRNGDRMTLAGPLPAGISASVDWSVIVLSGSASNADYAAALAQVRYSSVSDNPTDYGTDQDRTILIRVDTDVGSQLIGTAAISVIGVDDPAVARDDDFGLLENVSSFISSVFTSHGHGADFDPDNQGAGALTVTQVNGSAANVGNAFVLPSGAILRLNANGSFSYEPNHAFDSTPAPGSGATNQPAFDSFTYTLAGGSTATVTMTITGVDSADFLVGPAGPNTLAGGNGNDTYLLDDPNDLVIETAGGGARDVVYVPFSYTLGQGVYVEVLSTSSQAGTAPLVLVGNELGQEILGNAGNNFLQGGGGTDYLVGFGGNDTYFVAGPGDNVVESAGGGTDIIYTPLDYTMIGGVEVELLASSNQSGTNAQTLIGNGFSQTIYGNNGANFIDGGGGADTLIGLAGNDVYVVDSMDDYVAESAGGGTDVVYARTSYALAAGQEVEILSTASQSDTAGIDLTGNNLANSLYGNAGANVLNGGAGADYMLGFGGADTFAFTTALGGGNVDQLGDFLAADDTIALDDAVFAGLTPGALPAGAFVAGGAAGDADDRIVYNSATGQLFFDADGSGAGAQMLFATLQPGTALTASDFVVI